MPPTSSRWNEMHSVSTFGAKCLSFDIDDIVILDKFGSFMFICFLDQPPTENVLFGFAHISICIISTS